MALPKVQIMDGKLFVNEKPCTIGTLKFEKELSRGANGIVFKASDPVLERVVAVKFWLNLREGDLRDKSVQGLSEARKIWQARREVVADVYFSGYIDHLFYTVMEFLEGVTLKEWLDKKTETLGARCHVAEQIVTFDNDLRKSGIVHGDLHSKNVMISEDTSPRDYFDISKNKRWKLKALDFGTSHFSGKEASLKRHFRVIEETVNRCIHPFKVSELEAVKKPSNPTPESMTTWFLKSIHSIRAALFTEGHEYVGWPFFINSFKGPTCEGFIESKTSEEMVRRFIAEGKITATPAFLGVSEEWGSFDGRFARRED